MSKTALIDGLLKCLIDGEKGNNLDVQIELAVFQPCAEYASARANSAGSKVIYTRHDGTQNTCWAPDWTRDRVTASVALTLARKLAQATEGSPLVDLRIHAPLNEALDAAIDRVDGFIAAHQAIKSNDPERIHGYHVGEDSQAILTVSDLQTLRRGAISPLPETPPPGLLMSMAIRYDHGLGVPGYYDQPMFKRENGPSHAQRLVAALTTMRQLYEEVAGTGFYSFTKEAAYAARAEEAGTLETDRLEWWHSRDVDSESSEGPYASREEAIKAGLTEHAGEVDFYIQAAPPRGRSELFGARSIIEMSIEQDNDNGEFGEDYPDGTPPLEAVTALNDQLKRWTALWGHTMPEHWCFHTQKAERIDATTGEALPIPPLKWTGSGPAPETLPKTE